jgi:hypothetical protein
MLADFASIDAIVRDHRDECSPPSRRIFAMMARRRVENLAAVILASLRRDYLHTSRRTLSGARPCWGRASGGGVPDLWKISALFQGLVQLEASRM